jgi:hypothetical protein
VSEKLTVPVDLSAGDYALAVAVVDESLTPVVKLAIKGRAADGWYPLSKVVIVRQ